jgi:hypothetical protein
MLIIANIDEASDLEACELLAANAQNLSLVISETLRHTHLACRRIDEATRVKLGLSKIETPSGIVNQVSNLLKVLHISLCLWEEGFPIFYAQ